MYSRKNAGLNFKEEDVFKDTNSMYWIRNWYNDIDPAKIHNKIIVHGHSARNFETLQQDINEKKHLAINIDCGCVYHVKTGQGYLCALDLDTMQPILQKNVDKIEKLESNSAI